MIPKREAPDADFIQFIGEKIHGGTTRNVHKLIGHPELVIKVSKASHRANWTEYLTYKALSENSDADLFGHVQSISETGKYLIMEHLADIPFEQVPQLPPVPQWFSDRKRSAFGFCGASKIKIRDYGEVALERVLSSMPREDMPTSRDRDEMKRFLEVVKIKSD
jgi:hypothetical protein